MKKYITLILIIFLISNCKAQSFLDKLKASHLKENWFKDVNNDLNPFEGTYLYTNGTTSLKITFQKKLQSAMYDGDVLIGEYQYIKNGVEKVNTLAALNTPYTDKRSYSIRANSIFLCKDYGWNTCTDTEKVVSGSLLDPLSGNYNPIQLRRITVNGKQAIEMNFYYEGIYFKKFGDPVPANFGLVEQNYIMIKQ